MRKHRSAEGATTVAKTWGPFTGRQLTTVLCVLIVTVLFPVTSWAVAGSAVFVTDPHNNHHAAVDANGNVQTKISGGVSINGSAPGNLAPISSFVESEEIVLSGTLAPVLTPGAGKELIVTTINEDWTGDNTATASYAAVTIGDGGTCTNASATLGYYFDLPTGAGNHVSQFTPGYIVPAGKSLCALKFGTSNPGVFLSALGYTVPAGSVAAPAATAGAHARVHLR